MCADMTRRKRTSSTLIAPRYASASSRCSSRVRRGLFFMRKNYTQNLRQFAASICSVSRRPIATRAVSSQVMASPFRATLVFVAARLCALSVAACKWKPSAPPPPQPDRNPYREVMPEKVKQKVEDSQKKEEQRADKLIETAK